MPTSKNQALAFFRCSWKNALHRIFVSHTNNGGKTWSASTPTSLPNPNSAAFAVKADNKIRIIYNDHLKSRYNLSIAENSYPFIKNWKNLYVFKDSAKTTMAYPYATQHKGNMYMVVSASSCKEIRLYKLF